MMRLARLFILALTLASLGATAGYAAKLSGSKLTAELKSDLKRRVEETSAWRTKIDKAQKGTPMRAFTASSSRPSAGRGPVGFRVTGKISPKSGRTVIISVSGP